MKTGKNIWQKKIVLKLSFQPSLKQLSMKRDEKNFSLQLPKLWKSFFFFFFIKLSTRLNLNSHKFLLSTQSTEFLPHEIIKKKEKEEVAKPKQSFFLNFSPPQCVVQLPVPRLNAWKLLMETNLLLAIFNFLLMLHHPPFYIFSFQLFLLNRTDRWMFKI